MTDLSAHRVTVVTRIGCHLCEQGEADVARICGELGVPWTTVDVDGDPELRAEYGDMVPVFLVDGAQHGYGEIEERRFRERLARLG